MHRTNIYLEDEQCEALDRLAAQEGASRAEVIRRIIDAALERGTRDAEADVAAIEASFGVLADVAVGGLRAVDERAQHLERMRRLEA